MGANAGENWPLGLVVVLFGAGYTTMRVWTYHILWADARSGTYGRYASHFFGAFLFPWALLLLIHNLETNSKVCGFDWMAVRDHTLGS